MTASNAPGISHHTKGSVFDDASLFPAEEGAELKMRAELLRGLERWLKSSARPQTAAAKVLGVTQARVSDIRHGKINQFSLDLLVRMAARAGEGEGSGESGSVFFGQIELWHHAALSHAATRL